MSGMKYDNFVDAQKCRSQQQIIANIILFSFFLVVIEGAQSITTAKTLSSPVSSRITEAKQWLKNQQDINTGLFRSYDMPGDSAAWTYDQAVGIMALLAVKNEEAAKCCADAMLKIRDNQYHVWADGYDSASLEVKAKPIAVGPNAWMGLALLKLYQTTKNEKYLSAATEVGEFILKQQVSSPGPRSGSISGGYDQSGNPFQWTSTEHNVDSIAFLSALSEATSQERYCNAAIRTAEWLDREMWDAEAGCYNPGYSDNKKPTISKFPERLDSQTWTILALQAASQTKCGRKIAADLMHNGLSWIDQYLCTVSY
jgi:uncharacterized protein YyaL (SSP411 family)